MIRIKFLWDDRLDEYKIHIADNRYAACATGVIEACEALGLDVEELYHFELLVYKTVHPKATALVTVYDRVVHIKNLHSQAHDCFDSCHIGGDPVPGYYYVEMNEL